MRDHEVVEVLLAEGDLAEHDVDHAHGLARHAEAHDVLLARACARARRRGRSPRRALVAEVRRSALRRGAQRLELLGRLEGRVGEVARDQRVDVAVVEREALRLEERPDAARIAAEPAEARAPRPSAMPSQARSSRIPRAAASEERA